MPFFRKRTPIGEAVDEFAEVIRRRSQGTSKSWKTDVGRLRAAAALLGVRHCKEISPSSVARVLSAKEGEGRSAKTVNSYREILHRFCAFLIIEKGAAFQETDKLNPAALVRRRRERAPRIVFLEQEQYEALLDGLSPHPQLRAMVAVMLFGGLRRGELLRLTKADVDLEQGLLHVRAKEVCGQTWQPKTGSNRSVRIWPRLAEELARWRSPAGTPWYFPSPRGTRWDEDNFSKFLRRAQKSLNPRWTSLHFRHTFGTTLARAGISLFQISKLMGNSPQIAAKHYASLRAEDVRAEGVFPGRGPGGREAEARARHLGEERSPEAVSAEQAPIKAEGERPAVDRTVASLADDRKKRSPLWRAPRFPTRKQASQVLSKRLRRARVATRVRAGRSRSHPSRSDVPDESPSTLPPGDSKAAAIARAIQEHLKRDRPNPPETTTG